MRAILGIDLGTTNTCFARYSGNALERGIIDVIENRSNSRISPSMVSYFDDDILIGTEAKSHLHLNPENTLFNAKRLFDKQFDEIKSFKHAQFKLVKNEKTGYPMYEITRNGKKEQISPEEVSACVLSMIKMRIEEKFGIKDIDAVITVPAYFNDLQREATKYAATLAKINVLRICAEPTAAAINYKIHSNLSSGKFFVFDFGGGTLDCSVIEVDDNNFIVKGVAGDCELGGEDIDDLFVDFVLKEYKKIAPDIDPRKNPRDMCRLRMLCEEIKRNLSFAQKTNIVFPNFCGGPDINIPISRPCFENIIDPILNRLADPIQEALDNAEVKKSEIDHIIMIGGSSRIPAVITTVKEFFNDKTPAHAVNPDESIAIGACYLAKYLSDKENSFTEDTSKVKDPYSNPREELKVIDVNPLSIGIQSGLDKFQCYIKRSSPLPQTANFRFTTHRKNQTKATVRIFQGESESCAENILLGEFVINGLPPGDVGSVKIDVTIDVTEECIVNVSASVINNNELDKSKRIESIRKGLTSDEMKSKIENHEREMSVVIARNKVNDEINNAQTTFIELEQMAAKSSSSLANQVNEKVLNWNSKVEHISKNMPKTISDADSICAEIRKLEKEAKEFLAKH